MSALTSPLTEPYRREPPTSSIPSPWVWITRGLWLLVALAFAVPTVVNARDFVNDFLYLRDNSAIFDIAFFNRFDRALTIRSFNALGIPLNLVTGLALFSAILPLLALWGMALVIFWRKSNHWSGLLTSFALLTIGSRFGPTAPYFLNQPITVVVYGYILRFIWWPALLTMLMVFPSGKSVPRYAAWIAAALLIPAAVYNGYYLSPLNSNPVFHAQTFYPIWNIVLPASVVVGLAAQIYRYRRVSGTAERQQAKWVLWGTLLYVLVLAIDAVVQSFTTDLFIYSSPYYALYHLIYAVAVGIAFSLIAIAIAIALFRYRLWDVDFIINRSLAYGAVTLGLAAVFAVLFFGMRAVLAAAFGSQQDLLAAAIPAVAVTAMFNPARIRVRRIIDQRFYGINLDYVKAAKAYADIKRDERKSGGHSTFGSYTDLSLLGRGGMGEVYRAQHPTLNRMVAIKILPLHSEADDDAHKRFNREAQTVARLKHPNIVTLHDVGEQNGQPFMVMEYVDGPDLSTILKQRGRLPLNEALPLLEDVAAALDYAHSQGVVHRDIKPSNVMVEHITGSGQNRTTRGVLMDFGIAKSYAAGTRLTQSGMIGTLDYISPEQIQGSSEVDARADTYSFGAMTYQVLTGEMPFKHNNPGAMVLAHLMQPPPDPREIVPDLPQGAAQAIMRAMAKKPEDRFATAGAFAAALGEQEQEQEVA